MKNKGLGTIIGFAFVLFIIIWLFKILMFLGIIASTVAIIYFGVKVHQENDNRKHQKNGKKVAMVGDGINVLCYIDFIYSLLG